jgi:hypothetical protein
VPPTRALFQRGPGVDRLRNLLAEWFYVDGGKILTIYAATFYRRPRA